MIPKSCGPFGLDHAVEQMLETFIEEMCDARIEGRRQSGPKKPRADPAIEPDPPARLAAPPLRAAPEMRYFACVLRLANSASLRSVMTPIWLAR
jgi:hypothetical protein